jgi:hypothetical protein
VTLYPNRDHTIYFENHKKPTLTVNKVDSITGSPIKGAKFEVWAYVIPLAFHPPDVSPL